MTESKYIKQEVLDKIQQIKEHPKFIKLKIIVTSVLAVPILTIVIWSFAGALAARKCTDQNIAAEKRISVCSITLSNPLKFAVRGTGWATNFFYRAFAHHDAGNKEKAKEDFREAVKWLEKAYAYRGHESRFMYLEIGRLLYLAEQKNPEIYKMWTKELSALAPIMDRYK